jgi:transposase
MSRLDPEIYLRDVLARIADHPINRIGDLIPWKWKPAG